MIRVIIDLTESPEGIVHVNATAAAAPRGRHNHKEKQVAKLIEQFLEALPGIVAPDRRPRPSARAKV